MTRRKPAYPLGICHAAIRLEIVYHVGYPCPNCLDLAHFKTHGADIAADDNSYYTRPLSLEPKCLDLAVNTATSVTLRGSKSKAVHITKARLST